MSEEEKTEELDAIIAKAVSGEEPDDEPKEEPVEAGPEAEGAGAPQGAQGDPKTDEFELPEHWSEEERAAWAAIPEEHRKLLFDARKSIETGYNRKSEKLSDKARYWKEIKRIFGPMAPGLKQSNTTKLQAIRNYVGADMALHQQPDAAFEHLARTYAASRGEKDRQAILARFARGLGVQLGADKPQAQDEYLDPVAGQKLSGLEQKFERLSQLFTQQTALARQSALTQAEQVVQAFARDHPHFETVRGDVEILLASQKIPQDLSPAERLAKAYDIACRMNPEVFSQIEAERKAKDAKASAEKRQAENAASKAASRNPKGQPVSVVSEGKESLDDIIKGASEGRYATA